MRLINVIHRALLIPERSPMLFVELIRKKRDGGELSRDEIEFIVSGYTRGATSRLSGRRVLDGRIPARAEP